jgi:arylsulfatase A-like enzyme
MLAEILREAGWTTAGFTGGGNVAGELGFARGFDVYEEGPDLAWSVARWTEWRGGVTGPAFAFLHGYDAHVPYDPPPPLHRLYDPAYDGPVRGPETRRLCRAVRGLEPGAAPELTEADRRHLVALYAAGLRAADARFGKLVRRLDETPAGRGAMVIVMSDHGEELWDHGSLLHSHTVYQELVHVPLLMRLPGEEARGAGRLVAGTVRNLDIAPTVLDVLGLPAARSHEGISLRSAASGALVASATELAAGAAPAGSAPALVAPAEMREWKTLVEDRWKLVTTVAGRFALYDLEADPGERASVAAAHRDLAREMAARLAGLVEPVSVHELAETELSDELRDRLRALGYVE